MREFGGGSFLQPRSGQENYDVYARALPIASLCHYPPTSDYEAPAEPVAAQIMSTTSCLDLAGQCGDQPPATACRALLSSSTATASTASDPRIAGMNQMFS